MRKLQTAGIDASQAIKDFNAAGYTVAAIALAVGRHISTVYAWRAGRRQPGASSLGALVTMIDNRRRVLLARHNIREPRTARELRHLDSARDALETDAERAEIAVLVERWTDRRCAIDETEVVIS